LQIKHFFRSFFFLGYSDLGYSSLFISNREKQKNIEEKKICMKEKLEILI
jgi:hypothetical protein